MKNEIQNCQNDFKSIKSEFDDQNMSKNIDMAWKFYF
jgi:ubiquinone/menaquinone biosynthesis C-methylase UbiE